MKKHVSILLVFIFILVVCMPGCQNQQCEHDFSVKSTDSKYLAQEATCKSLARYYYSCSKCGEADYSNTFEYGEYADHVMHDGVCDNCDKCDPSEIIEVYGLIPVWGKIQKDGSLDSGLLQVYVAYRNVSKFTFNDITFNIKLNQGGIYSAVEKKLGDHFIASGEPSSKKNYNYLADFYDCSYYSFGLAESADAGSTRSLTLSSITIVLDNGKELTIYGGDLPKYTWDAVNKDNYKYWIA